MLKSQTIVAMGMQMEHQNRALLDNILGMSVMKLLKQEEQIVQLQIEIVQAHAIVLQNSIVINEMEMAFMLAFFIQVSNLN